MTRTTNSLLTLLLGAVAACGESSGNGSSVTAPPPPDDGRTITASPSLAFGPATLNVTAGATVTFAFGSVAHDVYFDQQAGAPADIPGLNANVSVTRVVTTAGTYHYTCHIHPSMTGTIVAR